MYILKLCAHILAGFSTTLLCLVILVEAGDRSFDVKNHVISSAGVGQAQFHDELDDLDLLDMRVPFPHELMELMESPIVIQQQRDRGKSPDLLDMKSGWSEWSNWSTCSKSCGLGLSKRTRICEKSDDYNIDCNGEGDENLICNQEACDGSTEDFRQSQCSIHNDKKMFGLRKFQWEVYYGENVPPCVITCLAKNYNFFHSFGLALDGTSCGLDRRDVCFGGQCRIVGCDGIVGSNLIFDSCGVCGGNNSSCNRFHHVFDHFKQDEEVEVYEYKDVGMIPAGSTTVVIKDYSRNYIVLVEVEGTLENIIINGNSIISHPGIFDIAGSVMKYSLQGDDEFIELDGPTTKDIKIMLFYFGDKPLTVFEYWLPVQIQPTNNEMITDFHIVRDLDDRERLREAGVNIDDIVPPTAASSVETQIEITSNPSTIALVPTRAVTTTLPTTTAIKQPKQAMCYCKGHLHRKRKFCLSDFVIQVTVLYKQRLWGKYIRYAVEISTVFKSKISLLKREYVWFAHACCSRLRLNRRYFVMGRRVKFQVKNRNSVNTTDKEHRKYFTRLVVDHVDYWYPWRKIYQRRLKKTSKRINCRRYAVQHARKNRVLSVG